MLPHYPIAPSSSGAEGDRRPSRESGFKLASNEYYWLSTTPAAARDTHAVYDYVAEPLTPPAGRGDQYFGNLNTGDIPMIIIRLRTLPPLNTTSNYTLFHIPLPQENPESESPANSRNTSVKDQTSTKQRKITDYFEKNI